MHVVFIISIIFSIFAAIYWQTFRRALLPCTALAIIFIVLSACAPDVQQELDDTIELNAQLTEEIEELEEENVALEDELDSYETEVDEFKEEVTLFEDKLEEVLGEKEELIKENKTLDNELVQLTEEKDLLASTNKELQNSVDQSEEQVEVAANHIVPDQTEADTTDPGDCDIKGSVNGIYHTPGSTYYSRTTNVVEWFCSTEEAANAGYRAPKR